MKSSTAKKLISIRLRPELLEWFRSHKPVGYQSFMQSVLEDYVDQQNRLAERRAGRAHELFRKFYAQCFWHYDRNLEINKDNVWLVITGLRKYGGREGWRLAEELCR